MTFLHVSVLAGCLAALAPILFHMLGRRQPKTLEFPAIRFVKKTAVEAQRGWSVKRWILLALRVLMVLLLAAALAAPRVASGLFANSLLAGLLAILATLSSFAAIVLWGRKRGWVAIALPALLALGLWMGAGFYGWAVLNRSSDTPLVNNQGPVCAAIVIDTSPTMGYKYLNHTRLEDAKEMASWLMDRLPVGSEIAIIGSDNGGRVNQARLSAERQLDRVAVEGKACDLIERITLAADTLRKSKLERREVYVLSDMRKNAWRNAENSDLVPYITGESADPNLEKQPRILLQIIDLGVPQKDIRNWSLENLRLSSESVVPGGSVTLQADLRALEGEIKEQLMVELAAEPVEKKASSGRDGQWQIPEAKLLDRQVVQPNEQGSASVQIPWKDLSEGTNHAVLRLARPDPLEIDNAYYLTIEAREQGKSVVICDDANDGQLVALMLDPSIAASRDKGSEAANSVDVEPRARISQIDLSKYSSLVLFNPSELTGDEADRISGWVRNGGGLLIVLGPGALGPQAPSNNGQATPLGSSLLEKGAQGGVPSLLPGKIRGITKSAMDGSITVLRPTLANHPIWSIFERPPEEIPWVNYPVYQHWNLVELDPTASVIASYTQSELPMMVESIRGSGRIIVMTLPYPEPSATASKGAWSELFTTSSDAWPGFALFLGTVRYLATQNKHPLNYNVGTTAVLENNTKEFPKTYELRQPSGEEIRVDAEDDLITYGFTQQPGHYRLRGIRARGVLSRGFSVNVDRNEVSLEAVDRSVLEKSIGVDNLLIAKDKEQVQSSIGEGRYGRDLTPFLWVILAMMVMAEQTMSSRFYSSKQNSKQKGKS
ncbi:MAG: BatA domain-containing protein [Planctomycetota bacterium]